MSVKRVLDSYHLLTDGDMSASITTASTSVLYMDRVGYEIVYTGTPTGIFTVEVSNSGNTWQSLTLSSAVSASGSANNHYIDCESACKYMRLKYTRTSGTGTLNIYITSKSISG